MWDCLEVAKRQLHMWSGVQGREEWNWDSSMDGSGGSVAAVVTDETDQMKHVESV